jgi:hypothetical protein
VFPRARILRERNVTAEKKTHRARTTNRLHPKVKLIIAARYRISPKRYPWEPERTGGLFWPLAKEPLNTCRCPL